MSPSKILVCVTGSIAAYKSCDLVSQLTKQGHQVRVIMSPTAKKFVGSTSLQSLSGNPVYTDDFSENSLMSHIELGQWCDLAIVYPATAQTINSFAAGVGHDLHHSLFLAFDFSKPFVIAPAMNSRMLKHGVTQKALNVLHNLGCHILPTETGDLACGEFGEGRLLSPDKTIEQLNQLFTKKNKKQKRILITAGGTRETIDGVRTLTNMSTGKTGAYLADYFFEKGYQVLLLTSRYAQMPKTKVRVDTYESFQEIYNTLKALGKTHSFDAILHAAAISDYSIAGIKTPEGEIVPSNSKMSSQYDSISIELKRNEKILPQLKDLFSQHSTIVGFKLTATESKEEQAKAIFSLFTENSVDYVVHNDMNDIKEGNRQYLITSKTGQQEHADSIAALAESIEKVLSPTHLEVQNDLMS